MNTKSATSTVTPSPRRVGRPTLPASDRFDHRAQVGLNPAETASVNAAAMRARLTRSAWIRRVILRAAANANTETA